MPRPSRSGNKENRKRAIKVPEAALTSVPPKKATPGDVSEKDEKNVISDLLMSCEWNSYFSRPPGDLVGYYALYRWYAKEKMMVLLFIGRGHVRARLQRHFSGLEKTPIGVYLSSFPKAQRKLIWIKWCKDPASPNESCSVNDLISTVTKVYNNGDRPPFNVEEEEEELPPNFSILDF